MMNTNLLDLNNDILNIIGDYVKKDNLKREIMKKYQIMKDKQIINGKEIRLCPYFYQIPYIIFDENRDYYIVGDTISKDRIKIYLFKKIGDEINNIKVYARIDKIKLTKPDLRMCIWICFKRCKIILNDYKINLNMEDENNYLDEYLTLRKLNLKSKKYSFNY